MTPRLYFSAGLATGRPVHLGADEAHYLKTVLRRDVGADVVLFNEWDGEFTGHIEALGKKEGVIVLTARVRGPEKGAALGLAFAPVKRSAVEAMVQKGTELGVTQFSPVITSRTNSDRLRADRLAMIAREASEQSGRLSVPEIKKSVKLADFYEQNKRSIVIFCDEAGDDPKAQWGGASGRAQPILTALRAVASDQAVIILIGPEGGFTPSERAALRAQNQVLPVTLGPRILRADTAAIAALSLWQAVLGDWR